MSKKIKVLHLLPNLSDGGAEKVCHDILVNLDKNKFECFLLLFKENNKGEEKRKNLIKNNVKIISLNKKFIIDPLNIFKIISKIKKYKPHIIHSHLGGDIYAAFSSFFIKKTILISTEHNINLTERKINRYFKSFFQKRFNQIIAVSSVVMSDAKKRYKIADNNISVIYNGIDINYFKNIKPKQEKDKIIIGAMGRLSKQKNFETLIKAMSLIKNKNVKLLMAGDGELKNNLKRLRDELNLENRIKFLGLSDNKKFYNQIDIFVIPSLWEGLGLVAIEAAASRKIIIASQIKALEEVLTNDYKLFFNKNNKYELAEKIDYTISNIEKNEIKELVNKNYLRVKNKFSIFEMIQKYQKLYENITSK